jgi:hypothetical protein
MEAFFHADFTYPSLPDCVFGGYSIFTGLAVKYREFTTSCLASEYLPRGKTFPVLVFAILELQEIMCVTNKATII